MVFAIGGEVLEIKLTPEQLALLRDNLDGGA